jgi:hypothetical protein
MNPISPHPTSVLDIVSLGYKQALRSLWPISRLYSPMLALVIVGLIGMIYLRLPKEFLYIWLIAYVLFILYGNYVIARYVRDALQSELRKNIFSYWLPDHTLPGTIGIGLMVALFGVAYGVVGMLGLLLLVFPGLAVFIYYHHWVGLCFVDYLRNPGNSISETRQRVGLLLKGQFWRTIALGVIVTLIYLMFDTFLSVSGALIRAIAKGFQSGSMLNSPLYLTVTAFTSCLKLWFSLTFGFSAYCFIINTKCLRFWTRMIRP